MKKILLLVSVVLISYNINAQDDEEYATILTDIKRISGFGGPLMGFTKIDGDITHMMGGGGGVLLDDFYFGGYGIGSTTKIQSKLSIYNNGEIEIGHGGFIFGYTFMGKNKTTMPNFYFAIIIYA